MKHQANSPKPTRPGFFRSPIAKVLAVSFAVLIATSVAGRAQDPPAKQEKEIAKTITGIVVNQKDLPAKEHALELYMVINGIVRDAYGAPLKSAISIGPNRQIVSMMMFPVQGKTDAAGRFTLELPKYVLVPSGVEMTGWTVVGLDADRKVMLLKTRGEIVNVAVDPELTSIDLGKLTLSPATAEP